MLTLLLCVGLWVCAVWYLRPRMKAHDLPPAYPGALPLMGHAHMLLTDTSKLWRRIQDVADNCNKQGGVTHAMIARQLFYIINDPQDSLTASNACLHKNIAFDFAKPWLGDGLLTGSGEIWKRHRKLLNPAFSLPVIHSFIVVFNNQARKLAQNVEHHAGTGPFDHMDYLRSITLETFCIGTFGINPVEDKEFTNNYMDAVDQMLHLVTHRFQTFWLHNNYLYKLSECYRKQVQSVNTLEKMSNEILQRKRAILKNTSSDNTNGCNNNNYLKTREIKYRPVLDLLLELAADGTLTDKEIRDEMNTMIVAGFETMSNQLTYTLLLLGAHPEVQNKMVKELLDVLGPDRDVYKEDLNKLVYTNAVLMESLRVFPSVPILPRRVDTDVKLKNYTMRAGSQCLLLPLAFKNDPAYGPDGDKFRPERWLESETLSGNKEFAAFGLGKRSCIGRQYAMASMKIFLAHFLRRYKISGDLSNLKLKCDFVLKPISGYEISIDKK